MKLLSSSLSHGSSVVVLLVAVAAAKSSSSVCGNAFVPTTPYFFSKTATTATTQDQHQHQHQLQFKTRNVMLPRPPHIATSPTQSLISTTTSPSSKSSSSSLWSTTTHNNNSSNNNNENPSFKDMAYGESSRRYRRTVYTHKDWVEHRSHKRFMRNVMHFFKSGIYRNIAKEVLLTVLISTVVVIWNGIAGGGFTNFDGTTIIKQTSIFGGSSAFASQQATAMKIPMLKISLIPFTLASPFLGLILVFRTNAAYKRWDEARKAWGQNINHTRDLIRMGNAFYDDELNSSQTPYVSSLSKEQKQLKKSYDLQRLNICTWAFVRSMKRHLSPDFPDDEELNFQEELYSKLPTEEQALGIINSDHRPNRALHDLSCAIEYLPMHFLRKNQLHSSLKKFEDNLGTSERLLFTPVPIFYNRHTARFLTFWLLLLPLALYDSFKCTWNHIGLIPTTAMMSLFLFGIEELATQMEEPFTILPMQGFCDKIYNWCTEICSFVDGDNGITTRKLPSNTYQNYL